MQLERRKRAWKLQETSASENTNPREKTKYACIVEAHESTRKHLQSAHPRNYEDHIAEKGFKSFTHHNLVHKFFHMPKAMKIPDAKAAVDKEWKKLETIPAWQLEIVKSKKFSGTTKREKENPLGYMDVHLSSKAPNI